MTEDYVADRIAFPHLVGLRDAIPAELDARGLPGLCESLTGTGAETALEFCDTECDGMAWARLVNAYASSSFPNPDAAPTRGVSLMAETFEIGLVRGTALPDDPREPSGAEDLEAQAGLQMADMSALLAVICAYFGGRGIPYIIGTYTPYGPSGACVGGSWQVIAQTGVVPKAVA